MHWDEEEIKRNEHDRCCRPEELVECAHAFGEVHVHSEDADILRAGALCLGVEDGGGGGGGCVLDGHWDVCGGGEREEVRGWCMFLRRRGTIKGGRCGGTIIFSYRPMFGN